MPQIHCFGGLLADKIVAVPDPAPAHYSVPEAVFQPSIDEPLQRSLYGRQHYDLRQIRGRLYYVFQGIRDEQFFDQVLGLEAAQLAEKPGEVPPEDPRRVEV